VFLLGAALCGLAVRRELRARPRRLLEATLTELARDVAWLRRQL